jgi:hypothetical protein
MQSRVSHSDRTPITTALSLDEAVHFGALSGRRVQDVVIMWNSTIRTRTFSDLREKVLSR